MCAIAAILLLLCGLVMGSYPWKTIYDRIAEEPDFSGFKNMIKGNNIVTLDLLYSGLTVFVPQNEAIERYDGFFTNEMVLYHVGAEPYTLKQLSLNNSLLSAHGDNPPLWVSVVPDGYYINNAKIVEQKSNYVAKCKRNQSLKQVLHVVDRVLDPMFQTAFANPSAHDFLQYHQHWKLGSRKVSNFLKRVQFHDKDDLFKRTGGHTFFVPIDDRRYDHRLEEIDSYVIEGHVVPNVVLFTRPATKDFVYETAANGDYIYIVVTMVNLHERDYVKSNTVLGNSEHKKGVVLAEVVKGNIPVTNGVVHLISQPLAVFDRELKPFPYLSVFYKISADPELNITYKIGQKDRINKILKQEKGMYTYFAPKNRIWDDYLGYSTEELSDILTRHLVVSEGRYTMTKLLTSSKNSGTILETLGGSLKLSVVYTNSTFYIVWGQKWLRVSRPDYECSDGVVHLIDGVFAAPKPAQSRHPQKGNFWRVLKNMLT